MSGDSLRAVSVQFPPALPISARVKEIEEALEKSQVVIVVGATGSGKTTQLPKIALHLGRGQEQQIGITQPRRIAATSVAARVATELSCELGQLVGYQIRFDDRLSEQTALKFMTDGILLAEIQRDPLLRRYDTLIIDEAHERSLNIDFLLGWLKRLLPKRPDLKVIVSSATIETQRFSEFFDGAAVVEVEGRTYPVDVLYEPPDQNTELADAVASAVDTVCSLDPQGDILVFLPGEREIRESERAIGRYCRAQVDGGLLVVQPLYARLSAADQRRVFQTIRGRKVILATNVAETSLTIPGIVYVIDPGTARLSRYDARTGTTRLQVEDISQASADQRKGRCGRVREGVCIRLYDDKSFAERSAYTDPEILRIGLASVILRMKSLGLGEVEQFPFLDTPKPRAVTEGYRVLEELGALDRERNLTSLGRRLARFPVDPRIGRMIVAGADLGCLEDILVVAAGLNVQDPRERPREAEAKAEQAHAPFRDPSSDFVSLLKLWQFVQEAKALGTSNLRRVCKKNYLSFNRVREWNDLHKQLKDIVRDVKLRPVQPAKPSGGGSSSAASSKPTKGTKAEREAGGAMHVAVHKALLSGLLSRIGQFEPRSRVYWGARQTRFSLHPSSGLARKSPPWVMAFELVQTSRLFARTAAKFDPLWLDEVAGPLLKRSQSDPYWTEKTARASVKEQATLYGLKVFSDRSVDFATISPGRARLMFLDHALVRGEFKSKGKFLEHNRDMLEQVARLRDKARQSDMLADDDALLNFFDARVGSEVVNGKTFEAWRAQIERKCPETLFLSVADVLANSPALDPEDYPDEMTVHGVEVALQYRFDPWADDDGVSLLLPLPLLAQLSPEQLDGTIPAWRNEKLVALLERLPKAVRKQLGPVRQIAPVLHKRLEASPGGLVSQLQAAVAAEFGVRIAVSDVRLDQLPGYLNFTYVVVGPQGKRLEASKDLNQLIVRHGANARQALGAAKLETRWERTGMLSWECGDIPEVIERQVHGTVLRGYPALADRGQSVDAVVCDLPEEAERSTRAAVLRLVYLRSRAMHKGLSLRVGRPWSLTAGLPPSKATQEAHRAQVVDCVLREAFQLLPDTPPPRSAQQFEALLAQGTPRIGPCFEQWDRLLKTIDDQLHKVVQALGAARRQPSGADAIADMQQQLQRLFPPGVLAGANREELQHYPRYLRAMAVRLQRALHDPQKDAAKLAPVAALYQQLDNANTAAAATPNTTAIRRALEELRVSVFAPELKAKGGVSVASLRASIAKLCND